MSSAASSSPNVDDSGDTAGQRTLRLGGRSFGPRQRLVMAIVNRTPDSFYDRGATWEETAAMERVHEVVGEGADIVDIGGVPAAPGTEVTVAEEIRRTVPFVAAVRAAYPDLVISVDTWRHQVARELCAAGADLLNDTWGGWDERLAEVAAEYETGLVCSHAGGLPPRTRPFRVEYDDVMADVLERTLALADRAVTQGVDPSRVLIDPAHDFGKNTWHSLEVTRRLDEMVATGWPVLVSLSAQGFHRRDAERRARRAAERDAGHHRGMRVARGPRLPRASGHADPPGPGHGLGHPAVSGRLPVRCADLLSQGGRPVIAGAAICPPAPLLARELTGLDPVIPELRQACAAAAGRLVRSGPEVIAVVGPGRRTAVWPADGRLNLAAFGPALGTRDGSSTAGPRAPLPLPLGLGARLLDEAGYSRAATAAVGALRRAGRGLPAAGRGPAHARDRVGLLVMADGSACRSLRAPGYLDPRAAAFDAVIADAVRSGDLAPLRAMDSDLARELLATGRPGWQVLAGAMPGRAPSAEDPL